jgi:hypothetical protein
MGGQMPSSKRSKRHPTNGSTTNALEVCDKRKEVTEPESDKPTTSLYDSSFPNAKKNGSPKKRKRSSSNIPGHLETHAYAKTYDNQKPCTSYCSQPQISLQSWSVSDAPESSQLVDNGSSLNGLPPPPKLIKTIKDEPVDTSGPKLEMPRLIKNPLYKFVVSTEPGNPESPKKVKTEESDQISKSVVDEQTVSTSTDDLPASGIIANTTTYQSSVSSF